MIHVKDFGDYSVKNVKSFMGREGYGFNCTLYRGKKRVAFCIDDASGGMVDIDWANTPNDIKDKKAWDEWRAWRANEQKLLDDHIATLPKVESHGTELTIDEGWFVTDLVSQWEEGKEVRKIQKACSKKILFRTSDCKVGGYYIQNIPYTHEFADKLRAKYGNDVEIFNEVLANGEIPSVLK